MNRGYIKGKNETKLAMCEMLIVRKKWRFMVLFYTLLKIFEFFYNTKFKNRDTENLNYKIYMLIPIKYFSFKYL